MEKIEKTLKVFVPKGLTIKKVFRIAEQYGFDNDTLSQEQDDENKIPYGIRIVITECLKEEEKTMPEIKIPNQWNDILSDDEIADIKHELRRIHIAVLAKKKWSSQVEGGKREKLGM